MTAPERIWAASVTENYGEWQTTTDGLPRPTEYVRADLYAALEAQLAEALKALQPFSDMAGEMFARGWDASNVAIALESPDDPHRVTAGDFFTARRVREGGKVE